MYTVQYLSFVSVALALLVAASPAESNALQRHLLDDSNSLNSLSDSDSVSSDSDSSGCDPSLSGSSSESADVSGSDSSDSSSSSNPCFSTSTTSGPATAIPTTASPTMMPDPEPPAPANTTSPTEEPTEFNPTPEPTDPPSPTPEPTDPPSPTPEPTDPPSPTPEPTDPPSPTPEPTDPPSPTPEPTNPTAVPTTSTTSTTSTTTSPVTESTATPSVAPTFTVCDSNDSLNIAFLLDESESISIDQWGLTVDFVDRIATFDVAGPSYVSLYEFHSLPGFEKFLDFTSVETGRADISDTLRNNPLSLQGLTGTWDAMNRVLDDFYDYRQTCTDGCDTRHDVLFLLTDGKPTTDFPPLNPNPSYRPVCPNMIPRVNSSNVDIVVVGIGDVSEFIDEVSCLDIRDGEADVFVIEDYNATQFLEVEKKIRDKICAGLFPAGPSDREGSNWTYADGNTSLGPVPTVNPDGPGAPNDTNINSITALVSRLVRGGDSAVGMNSKGSRVFGANVLLNAKVFGMFNLWIVALVMVAGSLMLAVCCYCGCRLMHSERGPAGKADFSDPEDVDF